MKLKLQLEVTARLKQSSRTDDADSAPKVSHILRRGEDLGVTLPRLARDTDAKTHRLVMGFWPFHSDLYAFDFEGCDEACRISKSQPFCDSLGKVVATSVGLVDPVARDGECDKSLVGGEHPLAKEGSLGIGYTPGRNNLSTAKIINVRDHLQINRPECQRLSRTSGTPTPTINSGTR